MKLRALPLLIAAFYTLGLLVPLSVAGSPRTELDAIKAIFNGTTPTNELFAEDFLKVVPPDKVAEILTLYRSEVGSWSSAEGASGTYTLRFAGGSAPCRIHLNAEGKIDGFWVGAPQHQQDSPASITAALRQLPGVTAVTVTRNHTAVLLDENGTKPLAVASAFKLYLLAALRQGMKDGRWYASQTIPLRSEWKSLPTGILQDWPVGTPVTLETLANLMMSRSDNTATDHLLFFVGREAVEKLDPHQNRPLLSTMEMFRLKYLDESWRNRYLRATEPAARLALLEQMATLPVALSEIKTDPIEVERIEWLMSTRDLCRMIWELRDDPALHINPGLVDKDAWKLAAFKGGSEPGVLNYTMCLQKAVGSATYCVSATINHPTQHIDSKTFDLLVMRIINLIENGTLDVTPPVAPDNITSDSPR